MSFSTPFSHARAVKSFFFAADSISPHFIFPPIFLSAASSDGRKSRTCDICSPRFPPLLHFLFNSSLFRNGKGTVTVRIKPGGVHFLKRKGEGSEPEFWTEKKKKWSWGAKCEGGTQFSFLHTHTRGFDTKKSWGGNCLFGLNWAEGLFSSLPLWEIRESSTFLFLFFPGRKWGVAKM